MNLKVSEEERKKLEGEYITQTQDERNAGILKAWMPYWTVNAFENYQHIKKESFSQKLCVSMIPKVKNKPAVIIGSGPSLDKTAPLLKDWGGAVFACGSNCLIPTRWGHQPEYICVFDAGDTLYPKMWGYDWEGSTLLTHPSASPKIIQNWKWKKYYYLMMHFGFQWFEETLPLAYGNTIRHHNLAPPNIRISIGNAGCTSNNAIQLAKYIGYDPIFLIGMDLGYPGDKERCIRWSFENGQWKEYPADAYRDRKVHLSENGILTTEEQIEYKEALMAIYKLDKPQLFDCSEGIITELPKLDFKEVVAKNGRGFEKYFRSKEEIVRVADKFLIKRQKIQDARNVNRKGEDVLDTIDRVKSENQREDRNGIKSN